MAYIQLIRNVASHVAFSFAQEHTDQPSAEAQLAVLLLATCANALTIYLLYHTRLIEKSSVYICVVWPSILYIICDVH